MGKCRCGKLTLTPEEMVKKFCELRNPGKSTKDGNGFRIRNKIPGHV